jgi:UDP:flavonoid glycosyltransferase YjiC (YdhE family)
VGKWLTRPWAEPWYRLRDELGLPPAPDLNPLGDSHSPRRVLALFSPVLAPPQPDWPPQTVVTGFPFFDRDGAAGLAPDLARFLDEGPPPVVFTLGDSAAAVAGRFFEESAAAAGWLGRRAVLVGGQAHRDRPWPAGVLAVPYAPYGALFPRAAAVVHAGGIGTTGLVLRAGRPALVLPFAHDQPDNAARATRLGTARTLPAHRYRADRAAEALRPLLDDPEVAARTAAIGARVRAEDGVGAACAALEEAISSPLRRATRPLLPVGPASSPGRRP